MATLRITTDIPQESDGEIYECSECKEEFFFVGIPEFCPCCGQLIDTPAITNPRD